MFSLIATLVGIVVLGVIVVVIVDIISKRQLKQITRERDACELKIKQLYKDGDYNVAVVGLLNSSGQETETLEVRAPKIKQDFRVGQTLRV
jgi:hypothetical protein